MQYNIVKYSGKLPVYKQLTRRKRVKYYPGSVDWKEQEEKRSGTDGFDGIVASFDTLEEARKEMGEHMYRPDVYEQQTFSGKVWNITEYVLEDEDGICLGSYDWYVDEDAEGLVIDGLYLSNE